MAGLIDTDKFSAQLRDKSIDLGEKKLLITNFHGSEQEKDFTELANCKGFGRLRHFKMSTSKGWPTNPLPISPAARALHSADKTELRAQLFQNASCNWRCWYCYVDFALLAADRKHSAFLTADEIVDLYLAESVRPPAIVLSGGQPDLIPEWVPWMMEALEKRGLSDGTYLWSDDNLSNDYFWTHLTADQIARVKAYKNYGRVCCFKGFDRESFSYNTGAYPDLFDRQFKLMARLLGLGLELYCYVTFTGPRASDMPGAMSDFVDRLQALHPNLPLRTVPLEVRVFGPVKGRLTATSDASFRTQEEAIGLWNAEIARRFSAAARATDICEVAL